MWRTARIKSFHESNLAIQSESDMFFLHFHAQDPTDEDMKGDNKLQDGCCCEKKQLQHLLRGESSESMHGKIIIETAVCGND